MALTRSPIQQWHEKNSSSSDVDALRSLALCDLSVLSKVGVKGPAAETLLSQMDIDVPGSVYDCKRLTDGGLIARLGSDEFMLESGASGQVVGGVSFDIAGSSAEGGAYRVDRQEATFLLIGSLAIDVLSQTCGIDFRRAARNKIVFTRVAGVSCGVVPELLHGHELLNGHELPNGYELLKGREGYRIWVDHSYAVYLWETLCQICKDLEGKVVDTSILSELR